MGPSVELLATDVDRYPPPIEATAYFCCLEALQNAAKHAQASSTRVVAASAPPTPWSSPSRTTAAASTPATGRAGAGLTNIRERVESVGGSLVVSSVPGLGTRIHAVLPAGSLR